MGRRKNRVDRNYSLSKWYNEKQRMKFHKALNECNKKEMEKLCVCDGKGLCPVCEMFRLEKKYGTEKMKRKFLKKGDKKCIN